LTAANLDTHSLDTSSLFIRIPPVFVFVVVGSVPVLRHVNLTEPSDPSIIPAHQVDFATFNVLVERDGPEHGSSFLEPASATASFSAYDQKKKRKNHVLNLHCPPPPTPQWPTRLLQALLLTRTSTLLIVSSRQGDLTA
jgi:hypothetical protein